MYHTLLPIAIAPTDLPNYGESSLILENFWKIKKFSKIIFWRNMLETCAQLGRNQCTGWRAKRDGSLPSHTHAILK